MPTSVTRVRATRPCLSRAAALKLLLGAFALVTMGRLAFSSASLQRTAFVEPLRESAQNSEAHRESAEYSRRFSTLRRDVPSCVTAESGHFGAVFGERTSPLHWIDVVDHLDLRPECLQSHCTNVVTYCCLSRFLHLLAWYIDALRRHKIDHFLSEGSLIGAVRSGGMPTCHYDAEVHVLIRSVEDEQRMVALRREAEDTPHVYPCPGNNFLWIDYPGSVRIDTYPYRRNGSHWDHVSEPSIPHAMLTPLRMCNFYGMLISCAAHSTAWNALHYGVSRASFFAPDQLPVEVLNIDSDLVEMKPERIAAFFPGWNWSEAVNGTTDAHWMATHPEANTSWFGPGPRCARSMWIAGAKWERVYTAFLAPFAKSMVCLRRGGWPSLLDGWDLMRRKERRRVLALGYRGLLPLLRDGSLDLVPHLRTSRRARAVKRGSGPGSASGLVAAYLPPPTRLAADARVHGKWAPEYVELLRLHRNGSAGLSAGWSGLTAELTARDWPGKWIGNATWRDGQFRVNHDGDEGEEDSEAEEKLKEEPEMTEEEQAQECGATCQEISDRFGVSHRASWGNATERCRSVWLEWRCRTAPVPYSAPGPY